MPSSVCRSISTSGHSVMVAMRMTTGRLSLSTTGRAVMDRNVSIGQPPCSDAHPGPRAGNVNSLPGIHTGPCRVRRTRPASASSTPPIGCSAAGVTAASAWTRSPPRRASPSARSTTISRARTSCSPHVLEAQHQLALAAFKTFGDRLSGSPEAIIDGLFRELAVWADRPRWAGSGFTRLVIELADLPGHPARLIARRHKAMLEAHLAELLARSGVEPAARDRPRGLAAVGGRDLPHPGPRRSRLCRRGRAGSADASPSLAETPLVDVRRCPGSRPSLSLPVPSSRDN